MTGGRRMPIGADEGSFRDAHSRVFVDDDLVLRALSEAGDADLAAAEQTSFFSRAQADGRVIAGSRRPEGAAALGLPETWHAVVEHPRLETWTYPYEWSFSMLRDAAALQLSLVLDGLEEDIACKDATPYNIQFDGARPVFIDVGSFQCYEPGEPWYGYLQFCQLYLYPLLLQAHLDVPFQPWLRGAVDGVTPEQAWRLLGARHVLRRGIAVHVALHARAQRSFADESDDVGATMRESGFGKELIIGNAKGLMRLVNGLSWGRAESVWSDYGDRRHYSVAELDGKDRFVQTAAGERRRHIIWDVGCNDGRFSRLVAPMADRVLAFDSDALVVDMLYRSLREERNRSIVPAVVDLADPAGGIGWRSRERSPFLERNRPDLVLCLAVVHHLAITNNIPVEHFLDLLVELGAEAVVEFPTEDDPMVHRLMRNKRSGVHPGYSLAAFEVAVGQRFEVVRRAALASGTRVLFHLAPR